MWIYPRVWELDDDDYRIWSRVIDGMQFWFEITPDYFSVWRGAPIEAPIHHWHRMNVHCGWCQYREMPAGSGGIGE